MPQSLKQQTATGIKWSAIERFANQLMHFVVSVVLARLLAPSTFGLVSMVTIFIAISRVFVNSGFAQALVRKPDRTELDNCTAFYFNIVVGAVCYALLYVCAPLIAKFYNEPLLTPITRLVGITVLINSLMVVQHALLTLKMDFKTISKASVTASLLAGGIGVYLAWVGYGVWALVTMQLIGRFTNLILVWIFAGWRPKWMFSWESFRNLWGFGSKLLASSLIDTVYKNLRTLIIGKVYSAADLGYYGKAAHYAATPSDSLTGIIQKVVYPVLCRLQADKAKLADVYRQFIKLTVFIVFPLMMGLAGVSHSFIIVLLGDKWAFSGELLMICCFSHMLYPVHAINLNPLQALGRSDLFLRLEIVKKLVGLAILAVTVPFGVKMIAVGAVVSSVLALFINTYYTDGLIGVSIWVQLKDIAPTFFLSFAMFGCIMLFNYLVDNLYLELLGGVVVGMIIYFAGALLFRFKELYELKDIVIKNILHQSNG